MSTKCLNFGQRFSIGQFISNIVVKALFYIILLCVHLMLLHNSVTLKCLNPKEL